MKKLLVIFSLLCLVFTSYSFAAMIGGGGLDTTAMDTSAEISTIVTDETGTGWLVFASNPTLTGLTMAGNIEMGNTPYSIDGGTNGIYFDSDNDGVIETIFPAAGGMVTTGANSQVVFVNGLAINGDTTGLITVDGDIKMSTVAKGLVIKQGANGKCGTFTANGATPVTVSNTSIAITDTICVSLNTVGGTVGLQPVVATITAATGFTVVCTAGDTSTYNYVIISNAS